jgi:hypothetical protein
LFASGGRPAAPVQKGIQRHTTELPAYNDTTEERHQNGATKIEAETPQSADYS